ncbi:MAG: DNA-directed RNA polymerase subunit H [Halobacteriota archaeon]|nr:DNA-directed RNA polymerase subunit H [Halobacteriota archaeon]
MTESSILDHEMVPEHIIISEEEADLILKKYGITKGQLPKLKSSDPVAKQIGAKVGDVVKVIRNSPTAGRSVVYRMTIK